MKTKNWEEKKIVRKQIVISTKSNKKGIQSNVAVPSAKEKKNRVLGLKKKYNDIDDLKYDLDLTAKMEVSLTDTLAFAPYVSYRRGQARGTDKVGTNLMIGLQLKFADLFNLN